MPASGATTIMVIRHAEKPDSYNGTEYTGVTAIGSADPESLVTIGWQRAGALVTLFAPPLGSKTLALPQPQFIYAANPGEPGDRTAKTPSQRPFQTISAVAAALEVEANTKHKKKDYPDMVKHALAKSGVVLICWQHEDIPLIGQALLSQTGTTGINVPATWPTGPQGARYDLVWMFSRPSGSGPITAFTPIAQMLLPGDAPV
jgi:hypothetical protein